MPRVNLSNGQVLNFPDTMSQDEIKSALQKKFPIQDATEKITAAAKQNPLEGFSLPRNILSGALKMPQSLAAWITEPSQEKQPIEKLTGYKPPLDVARQFAADVIRKPNISKTIGVERPSQSTEEAMGSLLTEYPYFKSKATNALSRIAEGTAKGTALSASQNKLTDTELKSTLKQQGLLNTLLEGVPSALKSIKYMGEKIRPIQYATKQASDIKNAYSEAKALQEKTYADVMKENKDKMVTPIPEKYLNLNPADIKAMPRESHRAYEKFLLDPTFKNLHDMQHLFNKQYFESLGVPGERLLSGSLSESRLIANRKAHNFIKATDKEAAKKYKEASDITRDVIVPYESNKFLQRVAEGKIKNPDPIKFHNELKNLITSKNLPKEHRLVNLHKDLTSKLQKGKLYGAAAGAAGGALTGGTFFKGLPAAKTVGALVGGASKSLVNAALEDVIQNPLTEKALGAVGRHVYFPIGRAIASQLTKKERK